MDGLGRRLFESSEDVLAHMIFLTEKGKKRGKSTPQVVFNVVVFSEKR